MKSFVLQSRIAGGVSFGGSTRYIAYGMGGNTEDDAYLSGLELPAACTIADPLCIISANTLGGTDVVFTLQKNGVDTAVKITIPASGTPTGIIKGTGSASFADKDKVRWKQTGGSIGRVTPTLLGTSIEPDVSGTAYTLLGTNSAGSTALSSASTTYYGKPAGTRGYGTTEASYEMEAPIAGTISRLGQELGGVTRDDSSSVVRVANLDTALTVAWTSADSNTAVYDSASSASVAAKDKLSVTVSNGPGIGTTNIEKTYLAFANSGGYFFTVLADDYRENQEASRTIYYPLAGMLNGAASPTEANTQYELPFGISVSQLVIRLTDSISMSGDSTLYLRKNGVDVGAALTIPAGSSGVGYHYQAVDVDFAAGDLINFKLVTGSGTRIRIGYMGLVAKEAASADALTADDLQSSSQVSTPSVGQLHALTADDPQSNSQVSTPSVGQLHALTADDLQSNSQVSTPSIAVGGGLLADDLQASSEVSGPAIGQLHVLGAVDVQSAAQVSRPTSTVVVVLAAGGVGSASSVSTPALQVVHTLSARGLAGASTVSQATIAQTHALHPRQSDAESTVSAPVLRLTGDVAAVSIQASSTVSIATLSVIRRLNPRAGVELVPSVAGVQTATRVAGAIPAGAIPGFL